MQYSLVAPFGGFFASAIKRAYKKKDFQSFLPGTNSLHRIYFVVVVSVVYRTVV